MDNGSIYNLLISAGMTPAGACGLMGNVQAESAMRANNAQDGLTKLSDEAYTAAADSGAIDFVHDAVGYGLAQWTYWSRKQALLNFAKARGVSVGDTKMQLDFCTKELREDYREVWGILTSTTDVRTASDAVMLKYERPADQSQVKRSYRAGLAQTYYNTYGRTYTKAEEPVTSKPEEVEIVTVQLKTLKNGATGAQVGTLQVLLNGRGYNCGKVDQIYGGKTGNAVKKFQKAKGLAQDGVVGAKTWAALLGAK